MTAQSDFCKAGRVLEPSDDVSGKFEGLDDGLLVGCYRIIAWMVDCRVVLSTAS